MQDKKLKLYLVEFYQNQSYKIHFAWLCFISSQVGKVFGMVTLFCEISPLPDREGGLLRCVRWPRRWALAISALHSYPFLNKNNRSHKWQLKLHKSLAKRNGEDRVVESEKNERKQVDRDDLCGTWGSA